MTKKYATRCEVCGEKLAPNRKKHVDRFVGGDRRIDPSKSATSMICPNWCQVVACPSCDGDGLIGFTNYKCDMCDGKGRFKFVR